MWKTDAPQAVTKSKWSESELGLGQQTCWAKGIIVQLCLSLYQVYGVTHCVSQLYLHKFRETNIIWMTDRHTNQLTSAKQYAPHFLKGVYLIWRKQGQHKGWHPLAGGQSWPLNFDMWPKINRVPPLIINNLHMKFETVVCIVPKRQSKTDRRTDRLTHYPITHKQTHYYIPFNACGG